MSAQRAARAAREARQVAHEFSSWGDGPMAEVILACEREEAGREGREGWRQVKLVAYGPAHVEDRHAVYFVPAGAPIEYTPADESGDSRVTWRAYSPDQDAVIDMEADGEWADSIAESLGIYVAPLAMQEAA